MSQTFADDSYQATKQTGNGSIAGVQHGAGNNPSTAAGLLVIGCLVGLALVRRSFKRYL